MSRGARTADAEPHDGPRKSNHQPRDGSPAVQASPDLSDGFLLLDATCVRARLEALTLHFLRQMVSVVALTTTPRIGGPDDNAYHQARARVDLAVGARVWQPGDRLVLATAAHIYERLGPQAQHDAEPQHLSVSASGLREILHGDQSAPPSTTIAVGRRHRTVGTLRDVYYHMVNAATDQRDIDLAIANLVKWTDVPRSCLGVYACPRGFFAGHIMIDGDVDLLSSRGRHAAAGPSVRSAADRLLRPIPGSWSLLKQLVDEPSDQTGVAPHGVVAPSSGGQSLDPFRLGDGRHAATCALPSGNAVAASEPSSERLLLAGGALPFHAVTWDAWRHVLATLPSSAIPASIVCRGRYLIIVEKDAVLQRLLDEGITDRLPCIVVTACGVPDFATRNFTAFLARLFPMLIVVCLVDYNPSGVCILSQYRRGSAAHWRGGSRRRAGNHHGPFSQQSPCPPVPRLRWLGMHGRHAAAVPAYHKQPLTARDRAIATRWLLSDLAAEEPRWADEVRGMLAAGYKVDIEAWPEISRSSGQQAVPDSLAAACQPMSLHHHHQASPLLASMITSLILTSQVI